jgi:hypothetical protein
MRNVSPILIVSIWIGVCVWAALDGHPAVLFLMGGYFLFLVFPVAIGWIWEKFKNKKSN